MALLQVRNLKKSFGIRTLFEDVSFEIFEHDRVGLIGLNGCGKSTLLSILMKQQEYDAGDVSYSKDCIVYSIDQVLTDNPENTLYDITLSVFSDLMEAEVKLDNIASRIQAGQESAEVLARNQYQVQQFYESNGGLTYKSRVRSTLMGLGFSETDLGRKACELSGGETRKAQLAKILLSKANLLILDEPTNHLDLYAVKWLEDYLKSYNGAYIVVSHDRYFLDRVTEKTIEMAHGTTMMLNGNYSRFMELKSDKQKVLERNYSKTMREIHRIEAIIEQQKRWNQERNYITIASKQKQIDRLKETLVKPPKEESRISFLFHVEEPVCNEVLISKELKKSFGNRMVFQNVSFTIKKGEHVCLIGPNGCGKTTLLRILMKRETADSGSFTVGPDVRIGYFEQNVQTIPDAGTILDYMTNAFPRLDTQQIRNTLAKFLFTGDDVYKELVSLSGGEYARIQMLKLMLQNNNMLILDEPTNYLDIASREQLEDTLDQYEGSLLVVTHDRYLIDRISDRIIVLGEDGMTEFSGDWDEYLKADCAFETKRDETAPREESANKNLYVAGKERKAEQNKLKSLLKKTEERISVLEDEIQKLEKGYQNPAIVDDYKELEKISKEIKEKSEELESLYGTMMDADDKLKQFGEEQ